MSFKHQVKLSGIGKGASALRAYLTGHMLECERIGTVIRKTGLPDRIPGELNLDEILSRLASDKKKDGGKVHFVLLRKLGIPFVNGGVPEAIIRKTLEGLRS